MFVAVRIRQALMQAQDSCPCAAEFGVFWSGLVMVLIGLSSCQLLFLSIEVQGDEPFGMWDGN